MAAETSAEVAPLPLRTPVRTSNVSLFLCDIGACHHGCDGGQDANIDQLAAKDKLSLIVIRVARRDVRPEVAVGFFEEN